MDRSEADPDIHSEYEVLHSIVRRRRSVRRFLPTPVTRSLVEKVLDVARLSPSAANSQPWEFVVVTEPEMRRCIARASASLFREARRKDPTFEWNVSVQPFLYQAPVTIVVLGDRRVLPAYPSVLRGNVLLRQSMAICVYGMQLAAASLGLGTAWGTLQGGPGEAEIRELLGVPEHFTVDHLVPLGYPDDVEGGRAAALQAARERGPGRRPLDAIAHWERFDPTKSRSDGDVERFVRSATVTRVSAPEPVDDGLSAPRHEDQPNRGSQA